MEGLTRILHATEGDVDVDLKLVTMHDVVQTSMAFLVQHLGTLQENEVLIMGFCRF